VSPSKPGLYLAVNRRPGAPLPQKTKEFLAFVLSREGQLVVAQHPSFSALTAADAAQERAKLAGYLAPVDPAIPLPDRMSRWEKIVARGTHVLFYVALIAMPLTGWAAMSASGRAIEYFHLFNWPLLPVEGGRPVARQILGVHELIMKGIYVLLALHVIGALKHHFLDRDDVLRRMLPFIPRRR